ncbi:MAG: hypothetical protein WCS90_04760, partial [Bacilli bacterium]
MTITDITHYLDIGLLVLFVFVLVTAILYFLRGLLRGWRYGTYRLIAFAILFVIAFLTLGPIADAIGNWDMSSFSLPAISYVVENNGNTYNISATFGTPYAVVQKLVHDTLLAYDVNASPEQVSNYAIAFGKSLLMLITLFLDGLLLATLGNLFVMLLWHIAFIHTIPKDKRQEAKKKGKLISGLEELVIGVVIGAMMLFPFTSMVNSLAYGWNQTTEDEKTSLSANNEICKTVQGVVDTYNNSLFSQVFFAWTKNSDNMSYDMALTNFLTQGSYSDASVGVINEMTSFAKMGSLLVEGGLISDKGLDQTKLPLFLTSRFAPELLRSLGQSSLVTGLLPYALDVVQNIDQVATYLKVGKGIKFEDFDYSATFQTLADIYDGLLKDDVLKTALIGQDGKLRATSDIITSAFSDSMVEPMHKLLAALDSDSLAVFDAVIEAAVYVACFNDHQKALANPSEYAGEITLGDFFPSIKSAVALNDENAKIPEEFTNLKWGEEIATIFDATQSIIKSDPALIVTLTEGIKDGGYTINTDHLTSDILDHLDAYAAGLFGAAPSSSTSGALATESATTTSCLLDSSFVENAMPKLLTVMQNSLNTSFSLTGTANAIDLTAVKSDLSLTDSATMDERKAAVKAEFSSLYNVVKAFVGTPEGKAFLKDTTGKPGIYFDPNGNFVGIAPGLLKGLTSGIRLLDTSKLSKAILPGLFKGFMEGSSSPLASLGITGLNLNFSDGKLGADLADLLDVFNANQGIISYLLSFGGTINASNADSVLKGILAFKDGDGNSQLGNLLKAFVGNMIINPVDNGGHSTSDNIKVMIEPYLKEMGFDTDSLSLPADLPTLKDEMDNFVGVLQAISNQDALGELMSGNVAIASLAKINFTEIFTAIDQSAILKQILGAYLDTKVLPSFSGVLSNEEIATYKIGFANVSDWAAEGAALDVLVKAAVDIGDLSKIDYLHSDPSAVSGIIKALAGSGIFQAKQSDG